MTEYQTTPATIISPPTSLPPSPPAHDNESSIYHYSPPSVSKPLQRAKTLTATRVSRFFKKQVGNNSTRESLQPQQRASISASYATDGPERPSLHATYSYDDSYNLKLHRLSSMSDLAAASTMSNTVSVFSEESAPPSLLTKDHNNAMSAEYNAMSVEQELMRELEQVNAAIQLMKKQTDEEAERKHALQAELDEMNKQLRAQEKEYQQIEHRFFEHTRTIKATDDDLSTIRDSFKLLKYAISRLIMSLNKKADKQTATAKLSQKWPHLGITDLESPQINLLVEKLVHEHLVKSIFDCPIIPGLEVNDAYAAIGNWLTKHDSSFAVRLRQQLAAIIAKSPKESEVRQSARIARQQIVNTIYEDLADVYAPFMRENDAKVDEDRRYKAKVSDIVDKAMKIAIAMRGQEVNFATKEPTEGKSAFDEETMVDVKGKTEGTVRFSIFPAFIGGDGEHGFLEKGKVLLA
ncbi:hypothetical protein BX666DRAFT_1964798 [Dichotomocladium elegans]|nr:hypothetical protein BX666DRAFT_1964798 [Dichotomocladium elegans]